MSVYKYSTDNLKPFTKFVCPSDIQMRQKIETTLAVLKQNIKFCDLEQLIDIKFPRDCCKYYWHRTEHMFLKFGPSVSGPM